MTIKFEQGKTYYTRSIGDHNCIITAHVLKRTPRTVLCHMDTGEEKRFRPAIYEGVEYIMPWGNYSLCPTIRADDTRVLKPDWDL